MKHCFVLAAALVLAASVLVGCVSTLDGRHQVGVPFVKDRVEGRYERPVLDCWTAAKDVLNSNGRIYSEDHLKSTLEASVNERTVWVRVEPLDQKVTRVIVQARGGGSIDLASEIKSQIAIRLATGNLTPGSAGTPAKSK
jgi:hypothetical protein